MSIERRLSILTVCAFCLLCCSSVAYLFRDMLGGANEVLFTAILLSALGGALLIVNKTLRLKDRNWLSFDVLFYLLYGCLHLGIGLQWFLEGDMPRLGPFSDVAMHLSFRVPQITLLSTCGLLAFILGFLHYSKSALRNRKEERLPCLSIPLVRTASGHVRISQEFPQRRYVLRICNSISYLGICLSSVALFAMVLSANSDYFLSAYSGGPASYLAAVANLVFWPTLMIAFLTWLLGGLISRNRAGKILPGFYFLAVMCFYLILGERGFPARVMLSGLVLLAMLHYRVRLWQLTSLVLAASAVFLFVGEARTSEQRTPYSFWKTGTERIEEKQSATLLLGGLPHYAETTFPALAAAVEVVPNQRPYFYGYWNMKAVLSFLPFHSRLFSSFLKADPEYHSSARFLTSYYVDPEALRHTGTTIKGMYGTTVVASAYLDFGLFGVVVTLFIVGALGGYFYKRTTMDTILLRTTIVYSVYTAFLTFGARSDAIATIGRGVVWTVIIYLALERIARLLVAKPDAISLNRNL